MRGESQDNSSCRERGTMSRIITGQVLLILCCAVYLIWWYRGFRPGVVVSRVGGVNGALLLITAALGLAGAILSLTPVQEIREAAISQTAIVAGGIVSYVVLLFVTKGIFHRVVTTELFLIVGWTMLELAVVNRLYAAGALDGGGFGAVSVVIAAAFVISIVLYVAYYRMAEMRAFYAAMVPLVTEAVAMAVIVGVAVL